MFGIFGGHPNPRQVTRFPAATVITEFPEILRNGEFFEMRLTIDVSQPFQDLQIGISEPYWRDLTINTMIPASAEEVSRDGFHRFSYGEARQGETLTIKIDGQINPTLQGQSGGALILTDGDRQVGSIPLRLRVFR